MKCSCNHYCDACGNGLTDKTNREGLIENEAYLDLKILMQTIINTNILNFWVGKRDKYNELTGNLIRNPKELKNYTQQVLDINKNIQDNYPLEEDPFNILNKLGSTAETRVCSISSPFLHPLIGTIITNLFGWGCSDYPTKVQEDIKNRCEVKNGKKA